MRDVRSGARHFGPLGWILGLIALAVLIGFAVAVGAGGGGLSMPFPASVTEPTVALVPPSPTVTATPIPPTPTWTPLPPTPTPMPTPTLQPSPTPIPVGPAFITDALGDWVSYDTLSPVTTTVTQGDLVSACFDVEGRLLLERPVNAPAQIAAWTTPDTLTVWLTVQQPLPEEMEVPAYWLFALDTDGDPATGRPVGDGAINPDLGIEITVGLYSNPVTGAQFAPYLYVWDATHADSVRRPLDADVFFGPERKLIVLQIERAQLDALLRESAQVEPRWEAALGRAAVLVSTAAGTIADFCPDLPER